MTVSHQRIGLALIFIVTLVVNPIQLSAWEERGVASWYGGIFQGRQTANGETYDTYGYTCAHKTLPFGTILDVTNLANGQTVRVRVNDRGPFVQGRIIDLTYAAAKDLDMIRDGVADVLIEAVDGGLPQVRFSIQVGAWGDLENAAVHQKRLKDAGLNPKAVLASNGITRISLTNITETDVFSLTGKLETLGYTDLFIYQERHSTTP